MTFIENKYTKWYFGIITKAQSEQRQKGGDVYYECHHILPKCMGGTYANKNLVLLTAREHFVCHWLLTKMTRSEMKAKMYYAFSAFHQFKRKTNPLTSFEYQLLVEIKAKLVSERPRSMEERQKLSKSLKGKSKSEATKKKFSDSAKTRALKENCNGK